MKYILSVFSIRTDTMQFSNYLSRNGIKNTIIETPKSASTSCGISVKFSLVDFTKAKKLLASSGARSFVRFYLLDGFYGHQRITPLPR